MGDQLSWALDIGNTHYKLGVVENGSVKEVFRFRTIRDQSIDEYYFQFKNVCAELGIKKIPCIWIASVVPSVTIALKRLAETRKLDIRWINSESNFDFTIHPNIKPQIGSDILILAQAAIQLKGQDVVVVCTGTATTVFAVNDGVLLGGAIAPGIKGSVESLIDNAMLLNTVFLDAPTDAIGQSTDQAMKVGILYGFAGLIDGLVQRMKQQLEKPNIPVIASGGLISRIVAHSQTITDWDPDLGIQGIAHLVQKNS